MELKKITDKEMTIIDSARKECMHGDDLRGKEHTLTVEGFYEGMFYEQSSKSKVAKTVIKWVEPGYKPTIITGRKSDELKQLFPDHRFDLLGIIGKKLTVYANEEKHFGKYTPVLHFKECVIVELPKLGPTSEKWQGAVDGLIAGTVTLEQVKKYYDITKADEKLLIEQSKKK